VSCHDAAELAHARRIGADFATLSPLAATPSHADAAPLGWTGFRELANASPLPVYALGGVGPADIACAHAHGAQGIAAIRGLWPQ
jgi:8-oxo-dGTP diphosphatase